MLSIAPEIFESFPGVRIGVIRVTGIDNTGSRPELVGALRAAEAELRSRMAGQVIVEHPRIAPWRDAFRSFGAKPKKYPSSIEALVRRVLKGDTLPSISPLVDLYNVVSLRHVLPVGGEDLSRIEGVFRLRFAGEDEPEAHMLGRPGPERPLPGEIIYADDVGAVCRRWNWRESARTCLTETTTEAFLLIETLPPTSPEELVAALDELVDSAAEHCGARCERRIITG